MVNAGGGRMAKESQMRGRRDEERKLGLMEGIAMQGYPSHFSVTCFGQ